MVLVYNMSGRVVMSKLREIFKKRGPIRKVGVVGMGYVGIPSAALFADKFDSLM